MVRPGGEADKLGNFYEELWTVESVLDVFEGRLASITVEPLGEDGQGVEFCAVQVDGVLQFHSVKRQKLGKAWSIADLCRKDSNSGRSVLGDLINKRVTHSDAALYFVSSTGANELRELSEQATSAKDVTQLRERLSSGLGRKFHDKIVPLCANDEARAFVALRSIEVITRVQNDQIRILDQRIDRLFYRKDGNELEAGEVRRMIGEMVLGCLGTRITTADLRKQLNEAGLGHRNWKTDENILELVRKANERYVNSVQVDLINAGHIPRKLADAILLATINTDCAGTLLFAPGGFGKSCVLAQCVNRLLNDGVPTLCLRLDSLQPCQTAKQIGKQHDFPASPTTVLAGIADTGPCVLVVDQLDAISLVSGRNPELWTAFDDLREEARGYPNMSVLLACREFDLEHDPRLSSLCGGPSCFKTFGLDKLSMEEIDQVLIDAGHRERSLTEREAEILSVPFHMLLFLSGDPNKSFSSTGELFDRYWDHKRRTLRNRLGRDPRWTEVIDACVEWMSRNQLLYVPTVVIDNWAEDAEAMISEHVLVEIEGKNQLRLFHESFFDYAYARRFCASGQSLLDMLLGSEQHLFRRAQVRQILTYERDNNFPQYIRDLNRLLSSPDVRFHIKRMVASGFRQIDKPTSEEWSIAKRYLVDGDLARYFSLALRDHEDWFDLLCQSRQLEEWLASASEQEINLALWFLEARGLHDTRSAEIAALISPYFDRGAEWQERLLYVMSWGRAYKSPEMSKLYLDLVRNGACDSPPGESTLNRDFWSDHHEAAKEAPQFVIDLLAIWFDRAAERFDDGGTVNYLDLSPQNKSHNGALFVGQVAAAEPLYFAEKMMPRVIKTVVNTELRRGQQTLDRAWPWLSNHGDPYDINDAILLHLRKSLEWLAKREPDTLRKLASPIKDAPHRTFAYLLLRAWTDNPEEFADECVEYVLANRARLDVGYGSWSGRQEGTGHSAITRKALRAVTSYCSIELLQQLEESIAGFTDEYENTTPRWRGYSELLLLRALDATRISTPTALRIEELERKFPEVSDEIVEEDNTTLMTAVGSPIPQEAAGKMTDDQWISAMQKYGTEREHLKGGPIELSRSLAEFARRQRLRFAALAKRIPTTTNPVYFSAILDGISSHCVTLSKEEKEADLQEIAATPTDVFSALIECLHALPGKPCGSAIANAIEVLSDRALPERLLEIVSYYAMYDADPESDIWQDKSGEYSYYGGNPYDHGINCVRGQAARSIAALLYDDNTRLQALRPALDHLANDHVISVRSCAITAFMPMLNIDRDTAVELFCKACRDYPSLYDTPPFERFVHFAIDTHYEQLRDLLQAALSCTASEAIKNAARQIALAELGEVDLGSDGLSIRQGTDDMRIAAAEVYSRNLGNETVGDKCASYLREFFTDSNTEVLETVSRAFWNLDGNQLLRLEGLIHDYVESSAFLQEPEGLLHALKESHVRLPAVTLRASERVLSNLGEEGTSIAYHAASTAHSIATLVVRLYEQTQDEAIKSSCLNLMDLMERRGYYGIGDELAKLDR